MTPLMCGILNMAGTSGSVITPLIIGPYMERRPSILLWISLIYSVLCVGLVIGMEVMLKNKQQGCANNKKTEPSRDRRGSSAQHEPIQCWQNCKKDSVGPKSIEN